MNGIHDLGGMDGFGPVPYANPTETFHDRWHGETYAMLLSILRQQITTIDAFRHSIEQIPPHQYLDSTYYNRWVTAITRLLLNENVITPDEFSQTVAAIEAGESIPVGKADVPFDVSSHDAFDSHIDPPEDAPTFSKGDAVRVKNIHPSGHTRCPRYIRKARGVIDAYRGLEPFPDATAHRQNEQQRLYQVRFDGTEIWGPDADPTVSITLDLWEPYLELADNSN